MSGAAGSAASQVAGFGVNSVLDALGSWVADGATWLLGQIGAVLGPPRPIDLGASWFTAHYATMAELAGVVIVPLLFLGIIQSVYRQNASALVRSVLVNVPLAILLTAVAVKLVQLGLAVTDAMSAAVAHGAGLDAGHFMASVTAGPVGSPAAGQPGHPAFIVFLGALAVVVGAVWCGSSCSSGPPPSTWPCSSCPWPWPAWPGRPSPTGAGDWSTPWWP